MMPNTARAADMRYEASSGTPDSWAEAASHGRDGQNVLYWDGHVNFVDNVYASTDPTDNIYKADKLLAVADVTIVRTHADALRPGLTGGGDAWTNW
jgi:prepilin-type processing-associated H-X9-DG protein